ncbi:PREDICTED: uncharacterized protein LOC104610309 [Nelumbo nucifera]|uniref:Uncharacterized protein LOC104610309 n=1 Tax=Nelumbo nucifera TaxID=4432 RepID=A0A1U8BEN6_NELNU|nr:PREDICTED: uncharacterized protein LOC104610309 [Nelumbo nucifera]
MKPPRVLVTSSSRLVFTRNWRPVPCGRRDFGFRPPGVTFPISMTAGSKANAPSTRPRIPIIAPDVGSDVYQETAMKSEAALEESLEKAIYRCRFLAFFGVCGSLVGSFLCFIKGCTYVVASFMEYFVSHTIVISLLIEAIDIYLVGTVMLVFGMGLYELFISNLDIAKSFSSKETAYRSNLFGLFALKERPKWLEIKSVNELKTKLGHVIVMVLLVGLFEKSKKVVISSSLDLLCFSTSILLSSSCLYLLSRLNSSKQK